MMSNRDLYQDEFGVYREVEEELEDSIDGLEDDDQDFLDEDDSEDPFDSVEADDDESYDEDEEYLNERRTEYDADDD